MSTALILFAHGARDPRWREPFDRLHALVSARRAGPVALAFLEMMQPDLTEAARQLAHSGATSAMVVPVFLGTGGHLRQDLPALVPDHPDTDAVCLIQSFYPLALRVAQRRGTDVDLPRHLQKVTLTR